MATKTKGWATPPSDDALKASRKATGTKEREPVGPDTIDGREFVRFDLADIFKEQRYTDLVNKCRKVGQETLSDIVAALPEHFTKEWLDKVSGAKSSEEFSAAVGSMSTELQKLYLIASFGLGNGLGATLPPTHCREESEHSISHSQMGFTNGMKSGAYENGLRNFLKGEKGCHTAKQLGAYRNDLDPEIALIIEAHEIANASKGDDEYSINVKRVVEIAGYGWDIEQILMGAK